MPTEMEWDLISRIRALRDLAEVENRRSPWRGLGFTLEADRLERLLATPVEPPAPPSHP